jgi:hypothetical protein
MRILAVTAALAVLFACDEENPCDRYADYVCDCHEGEEGFDCDALRELAYDPSQEVSDACTIDLQEQKAEDEANGATLTCEV